jgi:hypothetical protein
VKSALNRGRARLAQLLSAHEGSTAAEGSPSPTGGD